MSGLQSTVLLASYNGIVKDYNKDKGNVQAFLTSVVATAEFSGYQRSTKWSTSGSNLCFWHWILIIPTWYITPYYTLQHKYDASKTPVYIHYGQITCSIVG